MEPVGSEQLITRAEAGDKLVVEERRQVVNYLMSIGDARSNVELSKLFQVNEKTIREDRRKAREDYADELDGDDARLGIADIRRSFERQRTELEKGRAKCLVGSKMHLEYTKAIIALDALQVEKFQKLGILPETADRVSIKQYHFAAVVGKGDKVDTRRIEEFDAEAQQKIRDQRVKTLQEGGRVIDITPERRPLSLSSTRSE